MNKLQEQSDSAAKLIQKPLEEGCEIGRKKKKFNRKAFSHTKVYSKEVSILRHEDCKIMQIS